MKKILSFSLYGTLPRYTVGAIRNSQLAKAIYPEWECRFYCADDVPEEIKNQLLYEGAIVIPCGPYIGSEGMFWRFYPFSDPDVSHVIVRDTDSRISLRESSAVAVWLKSGAAGHIIRDHPAHSQRIMGGLWGARAPALRSIKEWINAFGVRTHYNCDQEFLATCIYPKLLADGLCVHDSFFCYELNCRPVPLARDHDSFIGEVLDENDNRPPDQEQTWRTLRNLQESPLQRLRFMRHRMRLLYLYWIWRFSHKIRS